MILAELYFASVLLGLPPEEASRGPNVVLIMTDDQGYGDLGIHGNPVLRTPHLDSLAGQSARGRSFYVSPVCAPTRASLMTGRWCQRTTAIDTWLGRAMLEPEEVTMAEVLGDAGWSTGIFGKWHLGDCHPVRAMDQGFQETLVHRGGGIGQPSDPLGGEGRYTDPVLFRNGERVETEGYCTDVYFDEAIRWMRRQHDDDRPFFLYLPTNAPHGPYHDVPGELYENYKSMEIAHEDFPGATGFPLKGKLDPDRTAREFAMIENIDDNVGKLMRTIDEMGIAEDTLVIFMHDNGPQHRRYNAGLRGIKGSVYEGGVRSPLFVRWPGRLEAGHEFDEPAAHVDVLPTILDACGVDPPQDVHLDGHSLLPLLEGRDSIAFDRSIVIQAHRGDRPVERHHFMLRRGRWKLVNPTGFGRQVKPGESVEDRFELYDLREDPWEMDNLAADHPEVVAELLARYTDWFHDVGGDDPANYEPPRISIGDDSSPRTVLTRQDWRGRGWGLRAQGHWLVDVAREGTYRVTVRPVRGDKIGTVKSARFEAGDVMTEQLVPPGEPVVFDSVMLREGPIRLEVVLEDEQGPLGPYQLVIEPVKPGTVRDGA